MDIRGLMFTALVFCSVLLAGGSLFVALAGNYGTTVPPELSAINQYATNSINQTHTFAKEQQNITTTQSRNILEDVWNQGNALVNLMSGTITAIFIYIPQTILSVLNVGTNLFGIPMIYVDMIMAVILLFVLFEILYLFFGRPQSSGGGS